jgi:hypothetical protein
MPKGLNLVADDIQKDREDSTENNEVPEYVSTSDKVHMNMLNWKKAVAQLKGYKSPGSTFTFLQQ